MTVIQLHNSVHDSQEGAIFVETPKNNEADERIMEVFDDRLGGWGSKKGVCQVIVGHCHEPSPRDLIDPKPTSRPSSNLVDLFIE